jgi:hypothetical protein
VGFFAETPSSLIPRVCFASPGTPASNGGPPPPSRWLREHWRWRGLEGGGGLLLTVARLGIQLFQYERAQLPIVRPWPPADENVWTRGGGLLLAVARLGNQLF